MHVPGAKRRPRGVGDERCTPEAIWRLALAALDIDRFSLDPATNAFATLPAVTRWTKADDGLMRSWWGDTWLNFPFSVPYPWVVKVQQERLRSSVRTITVLSPGDTGNTWWPALWGGAQAWAAWPQREHFPLPGEPTGSPAGAPHLWLFLGPETPRPVAWRWVAVLRKHGIPATVRT